MVGGGEVRFSGEDEDGVVPSWGVLARERETTNTTSGRGC